MAPDPTKVNLYDPHDLYDPYDDAEGRVEVEQRRWDPRDCAPGDLRRPDPLADDVDMTA